MDLNQSKCGVMNITRSQRPVTPEYKLLNIPLKTLSHQKDLGITVTKDLKWTQHFEEVTSKANSMLDFVRRTASNIHNIEVQKVLYLSLVRSKLGYASQVWAPQTVTDMLKIERIQPRATNSFFLFHTVQTHHTSLTILKVVRKNFCSFPNLINLGINTIMPDKRIILHVNDPPWITENFN